jgi:excisionase family DNA binding protein
VRRSTVRPQRLTSVQAAASYADLSARTIRRYIAQGLLPAYRVGPRLVKIDLDDLDKIARRIPTGNGAA